MSADVRMDRLDALKLLRRDISDEIIVATYSTATDWLALGDRALDYYAFGAMGLASSHALGLALAFPRRRVIVLDGDGSLLMNLGTLVTVSAAAPRNLVHTVWCNGTYEANGGLPLPASDIDFAAMARAAGYATAVRLDTLDEVQGSLPALLGGEGPIFAQFDVAQGTLGPRSYKDMYAVERRRRFAEAVGREAGE